MTDPILFDSHMHTPLCKHAWGTPGEYAAAAARRGLKGIIITCHNPGPDNWSTAVRMRMDQFDTYVEIVEQARKEGSGRVDVRLGLECDFVPGMESGLGKLLQSAELHHVLGSVHPSLPYYKDQFYGGDIRRFYETYFEHLAMAAETGLFDTLSHPDLVKNVFPNAWKPEHLKDTIRVNLERIAATGVAMELNTSGLNKEVREMNPSFDMLVEMRRLDIPVVLGSDAHTPYRVAADFEKALDLLVQAGYSHVRYYLGRRPHDVPITAALTSLEIETRHSLKSVLMSSAGK